MARGLVVATLLLVALTAVAPPFAHAAKEYPADAPAAEGKADAPAAAEESPAGKADAPAESSAGKADAPAAAEESPADKADAPAVAEESPTSTGAKPAAGPGEGLTYVDFVIKNPVKKKDPADRADGLPIDPTPDGQLGE